MCVNGWESEDPVSVNSYESEYPKNDESWVTFMNPGKSVQRKPSLSKSDFKFTHVRISVCSMVATILFVD